MVEFSGQKIINSWQISSKEKIWKSYEQNFKTFIFGAYMPKTIWKFQNFETYPKTENNFNLFQHKIKTTLAITLIKIQILPPKINQRPETLLHFLLSFLALKTPFRLPDFTSDFLIRKSSNFPSETQNLNCAQQSNQNTEIRYYSEPNKVL